MAEKLLDRLIGAEIDAISAKTPVDSHWQQYYDYYVGRHWKNQDPKKPKPVTNYCQEKATAITALLTDTKPRLTVDPFDSSDLRKADFTKQEIRAIWERTQAMTMLMETWLNSVIFGTGVNKVLWNALKENIGLANVHPKNIFPYADGTSLEDISGLFETIRLSPMQFSRFFPDHRWMIPDLLKERADESVKEKQSPGQGAGAFTRIAVEDTAGEKVSVYPLDGKGEQRIKKPKIVVREHWYWSDEDEDYRRVYLVRQKALPNTNILNPLNRLGDQTYEPRIPYAIYKNRLNPGSFWGLSEYSLIGPLQRDLNVLKTVIYDHIRLVGNTIWITDTNSDIKIEKLTNEEALIVTKAPGTELYRDTPSTMPSDVFKVLADIVFEIDRLSGVPDVSRGERPIGISAGIAIAELQEAAQVPIRMRARFGQAALKRIGWLIVDHIKALYDGDRIRRAASGMKSKLKGTGAIADINAQYDLVFDIESSFVTSRSAKINQAIQLYGMGLLDRKAVLDRLDEPEREDIMARMGIADALKQAMAAGIVPGLNQLGGAQPEQPGGGAPPAPTEAPPAEPTPT